MFINKNKHEHKPVYIYRERERERQREVEKVSFKYEVKTIHSYCRREPDNECYQASS